MGYTACNYLAAGQEPPPPPPPQQQQQQQQTQQTQQDQQQQQGQQQQQHEQVFTGGLLSTYCSVMQTAARTFVGAQRRHMQQHEEVAADMHSNGCGTGGGGKADSKDGSLMKQSAWGGGIAGVSDEGWGTVKGMAWVDCEEDKNGGAGGALPSLHWVPGVGHSVGDLSWESVAARLGLPCV